MQVGPPMPAPRPEPPAAEAGQTSLLGTGASIGDSTDRLFAGYGNSSGYVDLVGYGAVAVLGVIGRPKDRA